MENKFLCEDGTEFTSLGEAIEYSVDNGLSAVTRSGPDADSQSVVWSNNHNDISKALDDEIENATEDFVVKTPEGDYMTKGGIMATPNRDLADRFDSRRDAKRAIKGNKMFSKKGIAEESESGNISGWEACDISDYDDVGSMISEFHKNGLRTKIGKNGYLYVFGDENKIKEVARSLGFSSETIDNNWLTGDAISNLTNGKANKSASGDSNSISNRLLGLGGDPNKGLGSSSPEVVKPKAIPTTGSISDRLLGQATESEGQVSPQKNIGMSKVPEGVGVASEMVGEGDVEDYGNGDYSAEEAMDKPLIDKFQKALADSVEREGSLTTLQKLIDSSTSDGYNEFTDELYFIKNTYDLSDSQEVINSVLNIAETVLDDYQLEEKLNILSPEAEDQEEELGEYEEPEDWSKVDEEPETGNEPESNPEGGDIPIEGEFTEETSNPDESGEEFTEEEPEGEPEPKNREF